MGSHIGQNCILQLHIHIGIYWYGALAHTCILSVVYMCVRMHICASM